METQLFQMFDSGSLFVFLLFLLIYYVFASKTNDNEPPGPRPIPLFGNLLQLDRKNLHKSLCELSRTYGSVFTVWLGPRKVVVLTGFRTVKEALLTNDEVFGERAVPALEEQALKGHGLVFSNGETWREMRRFALSNLRDFGMGKKICEDKIIEECGYLVEALQKFNGEPFESTQPLNYATSNIICSMVYGSRFQYDDHKFTTMVRKVYERIRLGGSPSIQFFNMFPWTGRWIKDKEKMMNVLKYLRDENISLIQHLRETLNPQMCRGFIDAFMVKQSNEKESGVTESLFNDENLVASVMSLFTGGTESTSNTLRWGLLIMAKYPHIQDQVREEICRVISDRSVHTEDRKDLPFTNAVVHEIQRFANVAPIAVPHRTSRDITFQGHFIKKGTTVFPVLHSVHYDESEWEKPHSFHPNHFLDKDGRFVKRDALMPFSAGRRICLGEGLARMELFLFFVTLMQRFRFTPPPGVTEEELDLTAVTTLTLSPQPHKICAVPLT